MQAQLSAGRPRHFSVVHNVVDTRQPLVDEHAADSLLVRGLRQRQSWRAWFVRAKSEELAAPVERLTTFSPDRFTVQSRLGILAHPGRRIYAHCSRLGRICQVGTATTVALSLV